MAELLIPMLILILPVQTNLAIVHNGVIENHQELKDELLMKGHVFKSETDSEVIAHLLEHYWELKNVLKRP